MKVFKLVFGLILGIAAIVTILGMLGEEQGAGLGGALTGFVILMGIAIWLIFSAIKGFEKQSLENTKKEEYEELRMQDQSNQNFQSLSYAENQEIANLKGKGVKEGDRIIINKSDRKIMIVDEDHWQSLIYHKKDDQWHIIN